MSIKRFVVQVVPVVLCWSALVPSAGSTEAEIFLSADAQPFHIGEAMPVAVTVTNRSNKDTVSYNHQRGDAERKASGVIFSLTDLACGCPVLQRKKSGFAPNPYTLEPKTAEVLRTDLARLFAITNAGRYRIEVRIVDYVTLVRRENGKVTYEYRTTLDIKSPPMEFEVRGVDAELAARVDLLLKSGVRREIMEGLALLETARAELFRRAAPSLPPLVRSRDALVRAAALRVLLARAELTEPLSDAELYEALDAASREPDGAIRLAAAKALAKVRYPYQPSRSNALYAFVTRRMEPWVKEEPSAECRRILVSENNLGLDTMSGIIRGDPSPQVRAAAVRRLSDFAPGNLLKVAGSFGKLSGEVEMDGKRQPLAAFVAEECARVRARIDQTEGKGNVPAQAPAR